MADDISKGLFYRPIMDLMGEAAILDGYTLPHLPKSLIRWIEHPVVYDKLADKLLKEITSLPEAPQLIRYIKY